MSDHKRKVPVGLRLATEELELLRRLAGQLGLSQSEVVAQGLALLADRHPDESVLAILRRLDTIEEALARLRALESEETT